MIDRHIMTAYGKRDPNGLTNATAASSDQRDFLELFIHHLFMSHRMVKRQL
jgi:hypothetical protein